MAFAAHFPYLTNSIVLLAPVGILRYIPDDYKSFLFRYASFIPGKYVQRAIGKLLGVALPGTGENLGAGPKDVDLIPEAVEETVLVGQKKMSVKEIVQWQFDHHNGFCHSFVDTIRNGPIMNQHSDWRKVCDLIKDKKHPLDRLHPESKLRNSKLFLIFGDSDDIVVANEVLMDLDRMLGGREHLEHKIVPGGHGFPLSSCDEVVGHICEFWHI